MRHSLSTILAFGATLLMCCLFLPDKSAAHRKQGAAEKLVASGHLRDVTAVGDSEAWAVSERGFIVHTTDGGATWSQQWLGAKAPLRAMKFIGARRGRIVGNRGTVMVTDDSGQNWRQVRTPAHNHLTDLFFVGERGWALGYWGTILRTLDGGLTWERLRADASQPLEGAFFISPQIGWMVGWSGLILHTTDGGQSWRRQTAPRSIRTLNAVIFRNKSEGWAVGNFGCILHTVDGGARWRQQPSPLADRFTDIIFTASGRGFISGINSLLVSDDGGTTWQRDRFNLTEPIYALALGGGRLWRAGGSEVATSTDEGRSWSVTKVTATGAEIVIAH